MNVYTAKYASHWLGGHAVVVADNTLAAVALLRRAAKEDGVFMADELINTSNLTLLDTSTPAAHILFNGDY